MSSPEIQIRICNFLQEGRGDMGKFGLAIWALLAAAGAAVPAHAQNAPATAKEAKPKSGTLSGSPGAASPSYARCGQPIGGIIVKGGATPAQGLAGSGECPAADSGDEHRTYTGGRRNEEAPSVSAEASMAAPTAGDMPSRLSMTPTTARTAAEPPAPAGKSISEKGVSASRPH